MKNIRVWQRIAFESRKRAFGISDGGKEGLPWISIEMIFVETVSLQNSFVLLSEGHHPPQWNCQNGVWGAAPWHRRCRADSVDRSRQTSIIKQSKSPRRRRSPSGSISSVGAERRQYIILLLGDGQSNGPSPPHKYHVPRRRHVRQHGSTAK